MTLESKVMHAVEDLQFSLKLLPDDRVCRLEDLYPDEESETSSVSMYLLLIENEMKEYERKMMEADPPQMDEYQQHAYTALQICATRLRKIGVRPPEHTPTEE